MEELEHLDTDSLKGMLEAMLLVSDDSVPATEYEESRSKAAAAVRAIQLAARLAGASA